VTEGRWRISGVDVAGRVRELELSVQEDRCWLHTPPGEAIGLDWAGLSRLIVVAPEIRDRLISEVVERRPGGQRHQAPRSPS
jgi:hypothetical protein